ncbi:hypothetical protein [Campylobacter upsaliensis]
MAYAIIEVERTTNILQERLDSGQIRGYSLLWNAMKMGCVTLQKAIWSG